MLHVVTTGAYYPPVVTTKKIFTTGASYLTAEQLSICFFFINDVIFFKRQHNLYFRLSGKY